MDDLKNCKYCGAELTDEELVCSFCGKAQEEETAEAEETMENAVEEAVTEEIAEEAAEEAVAEETAEAQAEEPEEAEKSAAPQKKNRTPLILGCVIGVLAVAIIVLLVLLFRDRAKTEKLPQTISQTQTEQTQAPAQSAEAEAPADAEEQTVEYTGNGVSYTITADQITDELMQRVVATCGDDTLTAGMLNLYYWQQYYSFANNYGMYLSYLIDQSVPLELQMYDVDKNWLQMFLDGALEMFHHLAAVSQEADKEGFQLSAEDQAYLDSLEADLDSSAKEYGYESAEAYIQEAFGPMVSMEDYMEFVGKNLRASAFLDQKLSEVSYTKEDISAYFDENAEAYAQSGIKKVDKPNVSVRHILVMPEDLDSDGNYTEKGWTDAERKAQKIYDEWKSGEMTEDSFAELAKANSADGSAQDGGMIADIYPGQTVEAFNDWIFADGRQVGDHELVKTEYGYHIIYFSAVGEEITWYATAEADYLNDQAIRIEDEITAKYSYEADAEKAALFDVLAAQAAAAETSGE